MLTNFAFGGGGVFHGAPFHRLGVEHALRRLLALPRPRGPTRSGGLRLQPGHGHARRRRPPCSALFLSGLAGVQPPHEGYPEFTDWPNGWFSSTHQTMYYRWLERAHRAGCACWCSTRRATRPVRADHRAGHRSRCATCATTWSPSIAQILETYALERYIDAQHGGPGRGWFRIVKTPAEARAVIDEGKLAVILGIEISNLFDCFLTPRKGFAGVRRGVRRRASSTATTSSACARSSRCTSSTTRSRRRRRPRDQRDRQLRQQRPLVELDRLPGGVDSVFDEGDVTFGGLNQPREDYFAPAPNDMSGFASTARHDDARSCPSCRPPPSRATTARATG
jgi:hypothetical protein